MIVELAFPAVVKAKPPRCASQKQVICHFETLARLKIVVDSEFPVVARVNHLNGDTVDVRHDGVSFYRPICAVEGGRDEFAKWMLENNYLRRTYFKLMDDEQRNSLEYSDLTWPVKGSGRNKERRYVPFSEVSTFEFLDADDVSRCEEEVARLTDALLVCGNRLWIRCGEPCYRLADSSHLHLGIDLTFSDQNEMRKLDEIYISARDPDRVRSEWGVVADRDDRIKGFARGTIDVLDPKLFATDFDDIGFMKYADMVARGIAYYISRDAWRNDDETLMASDPDDIDLWNALRRTVSSMRAVGTASSGDEDLVMRSVELWERLGGAYYVGSRHFHKEAVAKWFGSTVRNWLDRKIELHDIVSNGRGFLPSP
ncbi:hypothetical protein [Rhizobium sp. BK176]|uniref:hypothetical protein n=1 Tax=Rhizobium sp. BK176 TaxID=2587071 RepID=UPI0021698708|nr:hypothetical protein [Rhizobium sp. BK176]MCS4090112.1 hypothetical protein [Rhizobium sp. BK176]